ncbi:hypothetical protein [Nocardioides sp. SR21]|uniref:hypothetical protein n=1 Tax=Nocardioides sp. SR21 TaxID=2919501 RepID=UPI001FAABC2A|nr:hypothetical protein [Nocardioides sp. SR21]
MRTTRSRLAAVAVATSVLCLLAACGSDDPDVAASDRGGVVATPAEEDAPSVEDEECFAAFPMGGGMTPDLADADLVPADFPEPPVDATLCAITGNAGVGVNLGYLSDAEPADVVAGYLEAFAPYGAVSEDGGHGVTAQAGDVKLLVVPGYGKYEIQLDGR